MSEQKSTVFYDSNDEYIYTLEPDAKRVGEVALATYPCEGEGRIITSQVPEFWDRLAAHWLGITEDAARKLRERQGVVSLVERHTSPWEGDPLPHGASVKDHWRWAKTPEEAFALLQAAACPSPTPAEEAQR